MRRSTGKTSNPIVRAMESVGMTVSDLVVASQGSNSNVWNLTRGLISRPTKSVVAALAAATIRRFAGAKAARE